MSDDPKSGKFQDFGLSRDPREMREREIDAEIRAANPFNPRTEVSADAKYIAKRIVTHMWILCVYLPILVGLSLWLFGVVK